ncbi:MAG: tol-pal system protein YbgF [Acidobacteriota bacterium]|jgi:tol-pal system protein YbgF
MRGLRLSIWSVLFLLTTAPAMAGTKEEIVRLQSDVLQLQDQIRLLQKTIDEKNGSIVSLLEQLNDQSAEGKVALNDLRQGLTADRTQAAAVVKALDSLRNEVQLLSTKLDETNNRVAALGRKMEDTQVQVQTLRTVPAESSGQVEPDRVYSAAYNDYLMGNYALAVQGFQDFLSNYPDSELADNAAYYLGDAYLQQGRQELAIQAFDQVINLYPKGDKTPVAYYKKGMILAEMQRLDQAIDTFKRLKRLYPKSQEASLADQELQKLSGQTPAAAPGR